MLYENLEISPQDLPDVLSSEFNKHPKRYLTFRLISLGIVFLIIGAASSSVWFAGNILVASIVSGVWLFFLLLFLVFEYSAFPLRGYKLRERDISYRSGLIFRDVVTIPFNRIQHSEISHGPIARKMKLSTLKIFTAGGSSSDLSIHGLEPDEAQKLKDWVTEKTAQHA